MEGIDFSDPDFVQTMAERFRSLVNTGWIEDCLEKMAQAEPLEQDSGFGEGRILLQAIRDLPDSLEFLRAGEKPPNLNSLLNFGMTAYVINEAVELPGGKEFITKLQNYAEAEEFSQFYDTVWEAEAAVFFKRSMEASRVELEPGSHPDLWTSGSRGSSAGSLLPVECKRISRRDPRGTELDRFADELFRQLLDLEEEKIPLKAIVWLHEDAEKVEIDEVVRDVDNIVDKLRFGQWKTNWHTTASTEGTYQVSVAFADQYGQFARRPIEITDMAAKPTLRTSIETKYLGEPLDPIRLRVVLQVRSDVLPKPIGPFERNLDKAIKQLARTTSHGKSGIAAIRLRPPRGKGDLYEADRIVRRNLAEQDSGHIGLVVLFWNETEEGKGPILYDAAGRERQEMIHAYQLKPYFIPNPFADTRVSQYDSAEDHFSDIPEDVFRSPDTGELLPVDPAIFETEVSTISGNRGVGPEDDAATIYLRLSEPYRCSAMGERLPLTEVGGRRFGLQFDDEGNARVFEVDQAELSAMATVDLHAWEGEEEFLLVFKWQKGRWKVGVRLPNGKGKLWIQSRPVWGVYV